MRESKNAQAPKVRHANLLDTVTRRASECRTDVCYELIKSAATKKKRGDYVSFPADHPIVQIHRGSMLINTSSTADSTTIIDLENQYYYVNPRHAKSEFDIDGFKWKIVLDTQQIIFTLLSELDHYSSISLIIHCTDFVSSSTFTSQFDRCGESVIHDWLPGGHHVQLEVDQTIHESQFDGLNFSRPFDESNAVLRVEDEEFHVHSFLLSMASQFFRILFNGSFAESANISKPIELKGISSCSFRNLLNCIYGYPSVFRITRGNIAELLELSHYYDCKNVTMFCEYNLCHDLCYNIRSTQKMEWAVKFDLPTLKRQLLRQEPHLVGLVSCL
uniref:BTB domain-containing protein n=1 Tax=Caenorhabditis japonica TaxID=281687 RepID=A0A8R1HJE3_CAEJA